MKRKPVTPSAARPASTDQRTTAGHMIVDRRTLGDRVFCRRWGPGRFRHALSVAHQRGLVRPATRGRYVAGQAVRSG